MSEEDPTSVTEENGVGDDSSSPSSRGRGRGRGRGESRGRGRGGGGRGRGRGRGGSSSTPDEEHAAPDDNTEADTSTPDDDSSRGRGRGRGGGRGRGRGGPRQYRPLREVPQPDEEAWEAAKKSHSSSLTDLNRAIDQFTVKIETSVKVRRGVRDELKRAQTSLELVTNDKNSLFSTYNRMKDHISTIESSSINRKREVEQARKDLPYLTTLEVDQAIKEREKKLNTRSLALAEERKVVDEVKELRQIRPKVYEYERKSKETGSSAEEVEQLVQEREEALRNAYEKKDNEEKEKKKVEEVSSKEKKLTADIEGWIGERRVLINQRQGLEREWSIKEEEHAKAVKEYESYAKEKAWRDGEEERRAKEKAEYEVRQARRERYEQERTEREEADRLWREEREREEAEKDPYEREKWVVDELLKYMDKLSLKPKDEGEAESTDEKQQQLLNQRLAAFGGKGVKPFQAKDDNEMFSAVKAVKPEKRIKAKKVNRVLTHVPDVFVMFKEVEVEAPLLSEQIEGTIDKLKEKKEHYETAPRPIKGKRKGKKKKAEHEEEGGEEEDEVQVIETGHDEAAEEEDTQ